MTTFTPATLSALHTVATPDEVDALVGIVRDVEQGHEVDVTWKLQLLLDIISRLAARGSVTTENGTYRVGG